MNDNGANNQAKQDGESVSILSSLFVFHAGGGRSSSEYCVICGRKTTHSSKRISNVTVKTCTQCGHKTTTEA